MRRTLTSIALGLGLLGCLDRRPQADPAQDPPVPPAEPRPAEPMTSEPDGRQVDRFDIALPWKADLLFVIDATPSMCAEQRDLARVIDTMHTLTLGADVRLASIVTTASSPADLGTFLTGSTGYERSACVVDALYDADRCASFPPVEHMPYLADLDDHLDRLRCRVLPGDGGAPGRAQGLESMRRALSCDGPNAALFDACCVDGRYDPACAAETDFLRPDAELLVFVFSDRDDCSSSQPIVDAPSGCSWSRDVLTPVDDYVDFLASLKARPDDMLLVEAYVGEAQYTERGHPIVFDQGPYLDARCDPAAPAFDPSMAFTERCCPEGRCRGPERPACVGEKGAAAAGHRYAALSRALNGQPCGPDANPVHCASICADRLPFRHIPPRTDRAHGGFCVTRPPTGPIEATVTCHQPWCVGAPSRRLTEDEDFMRFDDPTCPGGQIIYPHVEPAPGSTLTLRYPIGR